MKRCGMLLVLLCAVVLASAKEKFKNPIIPGFYPDPSVCRVGDDYYLVTSSFEWFPGLPIFHSKDLVHWEQIGHVLDRPSQLQMKDGLQNSNGLWAPTIRYHEGKYYVVCTAVGCGGNFFVWADNPAGSYSEPVFIEGAVGIDPSLLFDDDGKVWYCGSWNGDKPEQPRRWYAEDRIYVQQLDLKTGKFISDRHIVSSGYAINSPYAEAPHIYKIDGKYILLIAEGGTWENHAVTMFAADSVTGPYTPFVSNPVLTHRHLGKDMDITTVGHADIVQTQYGDWYAVVLGIRPKKGFNMLGRETFLTSLQFVQEPPKHLPYIGPQPIFNPGVGRVLMEDQFPKLSPAPVTSKPEKDEFLTSKLDYVWNFLRTPFEKWYEIDTVRGRLLLNLRPNTTTQWTNPSLIARRVQHFRFDALCAVDFVPRNENEEVGLVIMQNDRFQYRLTITADQGQSVVKLIKVADGKTTVEATKRVNSSKLVLGIEGRDLEYRFVVGTSPEDLQRLGDAQDATVCSTNVASGFIGPYVGMYASSNGKASKRQAEFDWFLYREAK